MTKVLKITQESLNSHGTISPINFDGTIEFEENLDLVKVTGDLVASADILIKYGTSIEVEGRIKAGGRIKASADIEADKGIKAGTGIKARGSIEAGEDIEAGLAIEAKTISSKLWIFAGTYTSRMPEPEEKQIRAKLKQGQIAFGNLVEPGDD